MTSKNNMMQESNSNKTEDITGSTEQRPLLNTQPSTIPASNAIQIQEPTSQTHSQNAQLTTLRSNINNIANSFLDQRLRSFFDQDRYPERYELRIRCWLMRPNQSDQTSRPNELENVVINFDNMPEPVTQPLPPGGNVNRTIPEHTQIDCQSVPEIIGVREPEAATIPIPENSNLSPQDNGLSNNRRRSETPNVTSDANNQSLFSVFEKYLPFSFFLIVKAAFDHKEGILIFAGLLATFIQANSVIKREIIKQSRRSLVALGILFVNLFVCICFIYLVFRSQHLYNLLIFIPPHMTPLNIWDLLWMVGITDFVLKFITIQLKIGLACLPAKLFPYSNRGKWFVMLECTSQLYRALVPIQPWLYYLVEAYHASNGFVKMFFAGAYLGCKGPEIMVKVLFLLQAFRRLLHNTNTVRPSKELLDSTGTQCPICQEDYTSPIMLNCRHIFCESCVMTWFDREPTCPLCRAKIADDPSWKDGTTSSFVQLF